MSAAERLEKIKQGLAGLGEDPDAHPIAVYLAYLNELERWNKAYNLTAIRDIDKMISHHLLDSLSVLPYLRGRRCLDVGTGAGLPGMILAMARPELDWVLLDSKSKKIRFLKHILHTLKPSNVEIIQSRVEDFDSDRGFDTIITRALTSLHEFCRITEHLRAPRGQLLAMKGKYPGKELVELGSMEIASHELMVPGLDSERFLIIIK